MVSAEAINDMVIVMSRFLYVLEQIRDQKSALEISERGASFTGYTFDMNTMEGIERFKDADFSERIKMYTACVVGTISSLDALYYLLGIPEWGIDAELIAMNWREI